MLRPKKSLGQNFLIDQNIIKKIIKTVNISNKNIVEIGPGTGNLTKEILKQNPNKLFLIEKDKQLHNKLEEEFKFNKIIKLFNADVLEFDIEKLLKKKDTIIFGNLPYNISTQILVKLIKFKVWPPSYQKLVLMFQKEVAEKILASFNTPEYGRLTVITKRNLKVLNKFNISKNCFYPKPKVDSTLLVFQPIINNKVNIKDINNLEKITRIMFSNKRKMINKSFMKLFNDYIKVSKDLKINLNSRPSELEENIYYKITEYFEKINN